ncbi:glycosyltransferase, partial [bacterium]|nr:glycosyltransferase [bacterium]
LIITTTKQIENELCDKTRQPVITIPNGYDPEDFAGLTPLLPDSGKVNLIYLGGFSGVRTSRFFVKALTLLQKQFKEIIAIHIVGQNSPEETTLLQSINDIEIHLYGHFPHKEALRYLVSADILILFIFKEEDSKSAIPGKIYEYLAAQKPIIAFCDSNSALASLLYNLGIKHIVTPDNVDEITDVLSTVVFNHHDLKTDYSCSLFDRKKNTYRLSSYFNALRM